MPYLEIALLGSVQLRLACQGITQFRTAKVQALLAYLAVEAAQSHSRERLAGLFWPEQPEESARVNLRQLLRRLRQILPPTYLHLARQTLQFNSDSDYSLDVTSFTRLLATCHQHAHADLTACQPCLARLEQAVALYQGDFLAHFSLADSPAFEEWAVLKREWLRREVLQVLYGLAAHYERQGDYDQAYPYAWRQMELDPFREEAHQQLMRVLAASGRRSEALSQYESCRRLLAEELDVAPATETVTLFERIRAGELSRGVEEQKSGGAEGQGGRREFFPSAPLLPRSPAQDWAEAPEVGMFFGREAELAALEQWLIASHCRLVAVLGMGGVGKTALAAKLTQTLAGGFEYIIWRSLLNAPPFEEILRGCLQFLSAQQIINLPHSLDEQLALLLDQLRRHRCLVVLDNLETILQGGDRAGYYRTGYEAYGQLIQRVGETSHQSCLLLTSRERPRGFARQEENTTSVRSLQLAGLAADAGQEILKARGLSGPTEAWATLNERYSGNPLALRLVAQTVHELFEGDITAFLTEETAIYDDIRDVLDQQFGRLPALERELIIWLAIEREAIGPEQLQANLAQPPSQRELLERLRALRRRSLIERGEAGFTLQNVVMEYVTDRLVEEVSQELVDGEVTGRLNRYALLKAQAKEYVRASQARLILQPMIERLRARYGPEGLEIRLKATVAKLRQTAEVSKTAEVSETSAVSVPPPGYAAGNLLNLLLHLKPEASGLDFSGLAVWQAYLQGMRLREVDFSRTDLTNCVFTEVFGIVWSVAFSPNGQFLAAGTSDGRIWVWQIIDGELLLTYEGHTDWVFSVCFSPDGQSLASGSVDRTIRLWNIRTGQCLSILQGHTDDVWSTCFSPDGRLLASGSGDRTIRLWDVDTGQCLSILQGHTGAVRSTCFSPEGRLLATGSFDHTIRLWEVDTGQCLSILEGHTNHVDSISFSPDGQRLVSGGTDQTIRLWDLRQTSQGVRVLEGHSSTVTAAYFSPDGQSLVSGSHDQTLRLWDVRTGHCLRILQGHTNQVISVCFSPDGQSLVSGSQDQTLRLWDVRTGHCLRILQGHTNWVTSLHFSPDGQSLASGHNDHTIRLWEVATGQYLKTLQGHRSGIWSICFSPNGQTLASSSHDQTIRLWEVHTGQGLKVLQGHTDAVWSVCFSSEGQTLASGSDDQTIRLWDVRTGQCLKTLQGHTHSVMSVCFSPDGQSLVSGSHDHTLRLWDLRGAGQCLKTLQGHSYWVWSSCFSPDGQTLASGSADRTIRLWDVHTGECLTILQGHTHQVGQVCFSPNGQILASSSDDMTIRLWNIGAGQCLKILRGHTT